MALERPARWRRPPPGRGRRLFSLDDGLRIRVWMWGPKWKRYFGVREVPLSEVSPASVPFHPRGKKLLMFTLEDDIRELVMIGRDELRPGVYAEW